MRGVTLAELLVVLFVISATVAAALPSLAHLRADGRVAAGARQVAGTLAAMRFKSVARGRAAGLFFEETRGGWVWYEVEDGNGNDLRTAEVRSGVDPIRSGPRSLSDLVEGVRLGFPDGSSAIPRIPPSTGTILSLDDPVQFGHTDLVSFTPTGSASSGTIYVTDGREGLYAVVLYGPTAKTRIWRYDVSSQRWSS